MKELASVKLAHTMHTKVVLVVLALSALVVMARVGLQDTAALASPQGGRDEIRVELNVNGFSPSEVQHASGRFAIVVENNAVSGEYRLQLRAEDGTVLNEMQVQKGSIAMSVNLSAGTYTLTETNHAQWSCRIVVQ